jgi:uncharacterized protein with HEPN domain
MHEYFGVDLATVWKTITDDLPSLEMQLDQLLSDLERFRE